MHEIVFYISAAWLALLLATTVGLVFRARTPTRRLLALDMLILILIGQLALFSDRHQVSYFLDAALILALLAFVASVAVSQYIENGRLF